jgi:hypothetical protein
MHTPVIVKCLDGRFLFACVNEHGLYWCEQTGQLIDNVHVTAPLEPGTLH